MHIGTARNGSVFVDVVVDGVTYPGACIDPGAVALHEANGWSLGVVVPARSGGVVIAVATPESTAPDVHAELTAELSAARTEAAVSPRSASSATGFVGAVYVVEPGDPTLKDGLDPRLSGTIHDAASSGMVSTIVIE